MAGLRRVADRAHRWADRLRDVEWIPLAALLIVALSVWAFVEIADRVREGELAQFDRTVMTALRDGDEATDPLGPPWLEKLARDVTALGSFGVLALITAASCGYLWLLGRRAAMLYLLAAVLGGQAISSALKTAFDRPRPEFFPHGVQEHTASFPSGHSMLSTVALLTLAAMLARHQPRKRLRMYLVAVAVLISLAVGVSRVYLGVHWPSDVLAGWSLGAGWALACWVIAGQLQRRGAVGRQPTGASAARRLPDV